MEAKATYALSLFSLAAKKKAVIILFRQDTKVLTAVRTAGSVAVCKAVADHFLHCTVNVSAIKRIEIKVQFRQ